MAGHKTTSHSQTELTIGVNLRNKLNGGTQDKSETHGFCCVTWRKGVFVRSGACCVRVALHLLMASDPLADEEQVWAPSIPSEDSSVASTSRGAGSNTCHTLMMMISIPSVRPADADLHRFVYKQEAGCHHRPWGGTAWSEQLTFERHCNFKRATAEAFVYRPSPSGCQ